MRSKCHFWPFGFLTVQYSMLIKEKSFHFVLMFIKQPTSKKWLHTVVENLDTRIALWV